MQIKIPSQFYGACVLRLMPVPDALDYDVDADLLTVSSDDPSLEAFRDSAAKASYDDTFVTLGVLESAHRTKRAIDAARRPGLAVPRQRDPLAQAIFA